MSEGQHVADATSVVQRPEVGRGAAVARGRDGVRQSG